MPDPKREVMSQLAGGQARNEVSVRDSNFNSSSADWNIPLCDPSKFSFPAQTASGSANSSVVGGQPILLQSQITGAADIVSNTMTTSFSTGLPFNSVVVDFWVGMTGGVVGDQLWSLRKASGASGLIAQANTAGTSIGDLVRTSILKNIEVPAGTPLYAVLTANSNTAANANLFVALIRTT